MTKENKQQSSEYPDTTKPVEDTIKNYLDTHLIPRVEGDEKQLRENAVDASKRRLLKLRTDTQNEAAASGVQSQDMADYSVEIAGDPVYDAALEQQKKDDAMIYLEKKELPPPQE